MISSMSCSEADGRERQLGVSRATFTDASPVFELNVWNREANQAPPGHFETFENKKCILETGHPLDHGTRADPSGVADE